MISSSPGELEPVFTTMLQNALRICEAGIGNLFRYENGGFGRRQASTPRQPLTSFSGGALFSQPPVPVLRAWSKQSKPRIFMMSESLKPMQIVSHS